MLGWQIPMTFTSRTKKKGIVPMADNQPHIEVLCCISGNGALDVATTINVDTGPLAMPKKLAIGKKTWDGEKIISYAMQVDEYAIWLGEQIQAGNAEIMEAIDVIYNKAIANGVILTTICCPSPNITHAHQVRRQIYELAGVEGFVDG
jgi:aspartate/tyrosine/aromatic aminotransferase